MTIDMYHQHLYTKLYSNSIMTARGQCTFSYAEQEITTFAASIGIHLNAVSIIENWARVGLITWTTYPNFQFLPNTNFYQIPIFLKLKH